MRNPFSPIDITPYLEMRSREARWCMIERGYSTKKIADAMRRLAIEQGKNKLFSSDLEAMKKASSVASKSFVKVAVSTKEATNALKSIQSDLDRLEREVEQRECSTAWNEAHALLCQRKRCSHKNPYA